MCLACQLGLHASERIEQLEPCSLGGRRAEDRFGVLEAGMRTERHVAKAQDREQA